MDHEIAFEMAAASVRFGAGVTREIGMELVDLGVRTALVVTDPRLARLAPVQTALAALDEAHVKVLEQAAADVARTAFVSGRTYRIISDHRSCGTAGMTGARSSPGRFGNDEAALGRFPVKQTTPQRLFH